MTRRSCDAGQRRHDARAGWARRALLSVLVLATLLFTLHALRLSDASYTAASNNSVNIYTAGSLSHTNDCDGQVMLSASGLKPGLSSVGIMTLTGTGDGPGTYTLDDAGLVDVPDSPALSDTLVFTVEDITGTPVTLFSGLMSDFDSANLGSIAPRRRSLVPGDGRLPERPHGLRSPRSRDDAGPGGHGGVVVRWPGRMGRGWALPRRWQLLAALAVVAAATIPAAVSGASFTTESATSVQASTAALSSDTMSIVAGNGQTAVVGAMVATAPTVIVTDGSGHPVSGVTVIFAVTSGGGTITGDTDVTGVDGLASVGSWTLGTAAGTNTLMAMAVGLSGAPITFTATGIVGNPVRIALNAGDNQTATVATAVATAPSVLVTDVYNNPVPGVTVTFAPASGGGVVSGGLAITDASGIATVGSWTLGTAAGTNTLTATRVGLTGSPVTFTATGLAGAASKIAVNTGQQPDGHGRCGGRYGAERARDGHLRQPGRRGGGHLRRGQRRRLDLRRLGHHQRLRHRRRRRAGPSAPPPAPTRSARPAAA